jgi:hypothetical protein
MAILRHAKVHTVEITEVFVEQTRDADRHARKSLDEWPLLYLAAVCGRFVRLAEPATYC